MESKGYFRGKARLNEPAKGGFGRLARPTKAHYTFAGRGGHAAKVCSLRLSVRTPPFHGGESGSIPLGSAREINNLAQPPHAVSNIYPINMDGRATTTIS